MKYVICLFLVFSFITHAGAQQNSGEDPLRNKDFQSALGIKWKQIFSDSFEKNWQNHWFLDGGKATIINSKNGMDFYGGPEAWQDSDHAVLWTKKSFHGNLRIEYDYTRLDTMTKCVTIFYLLAEGSGVPPYDKDIEKWSNLREIPAMKMYFEHMNAYHISYAAFENDNTDPDEDYVRTRRYLPERGKGLKGTELLPDYSGTGLFKTGQLHHITIILYNNELFMHVKNDSMEKLFHWKTYSMPPVLSGRLGLRHMYTRAARYHNFKVYTY